MVVCVYLPRFELVVAAGGRRRSPSRRWPGVRWRSLRCLATAARVGEVSGAAEAFGVRAGMALGEALARCPELGLVAADPLGVARAWEAVARALEGIGAALELDRPGLAYFEADGLRGLHGGEEGVIAAARGAVRAARASLDRRRPRGAGGRRSDALLCAGGRARCQLAPGGGRGREGRPALPRRAAGRAAALPGARPPRWSSR